MMKRLFDVIVSFGGIVILFPFFIVVAIAICFDSSGGVFFSQVRVGRFRKLFKMIKFRTMIENAELAGKLTVAGDARVTRVGRFLRKYKIDELPQLINVLVGEMSFVGPRPEVPEYSRCLPDQDMVFAVRPGITDPASMIFVSESELLDGSRDPATVYTQDILPIKVKHYCNYIENRSFCGDVQIILQTLLLSVRVCHKRLDF